MASNENPDEFTINFNIENFSMAPHKPGEKISSDICIAETLDDTFWMIRVYPRSPAAETENYVSIYLKRLYEDYGPEEILVRYFFYLVANDGSLQEKTDSSDSLFTKDCGFGFRYFISRKRLFKSKSMLLPNDTLKIKCRIERIWLANPKNQDIFLSSEVECETVKFNWVIENFSKCKKTKPELIRFGSSRQPDLEMTMRVEEDGNINIDIRPCVQMEIQTKVVLICRLTVLDSDRRPSSILGKTDHHVFTSNGDVWHYLSFLTRDSLDQSHLPNDVLTLDCEIERSTGTIISRVDKISYAEHENYADSSDLNEDFKKLFNSMKNSDVKLMVSGKTVLAHKLLLFARSPVFREILKDKSPDADGGHIVLDVDDVDERTLKMMLKFIYTEELDDPIDVGDCLKLFAAADVYQVISLKEQCSAKLVPMLTLSSACDVLVAAHRHSDEELEESAIEFLTDYWHEISLSEKWEALLEQDRELAAATRKKIRTRRGKE